MYDDDTLISCCASSHDGRRHQRGGGVFLRDQWSHDNAFAVGRSVASCRTRFPVSGGGRLLACGERGRSAAGGQSAPEHAAELVADQAVDDEVDGRVDDVQRVGGEVRVPHGVPVKLNGPLELVDGDGQTQADVGQLADDEDADDDQQHQRRVGMAVSTATGTCRQQAASTQTDDAKCRRETNVDHNEHEQRTDRTKDGEQDCSVDEEI